MLGLQAVMDIDVEDPTDVSLISKNYGNMFHFAPVVDAMIELGKPSLLQVGDEFVWGN
jgi:hypothetical protein